MILTKLTAKTLPTVWKSVLASVGDRWAAQLKKAMPQVRAFPGTLILRFGKRYPKGQAYCQEPSRVARLEKLLEEMTGVRWEVSVRGIKDEPTPPKSPTPAYTDEGINNCFFKTECTLLHDELRFRSPAEIAIYEELKKQRLLFYPNPAAVFGGKNPTKKEPDFLIFNREGKFGILEVMGATFHTNAGKDHERARLFKQFGILCIEFYDAEQCSKKPAVVIDEFLAILDRH
jgi:hypothetical protein